MARRNGLIYAVVSEVISLHGTGLLLEALRREEASRRWALESIRMAGFEEEDFEQAIDAAGLREPPADVLLPEGLL